jgi:hypothetical protein
VETRPYFVLGDLLVNTAVGALVGLACAALLSPAWNMWLGMFVGMALGMAMALVLSLGLFAVLFGAMEVMVPAMLTGMIAGMVVGMAAPMTEVGLAQGARWGALLGVGCLIATYAANAVLMRQTTHRQADQADQAE